ncbi:MAG: hypothetical protein Q8R24_00205 [Legionellaceae bacterium]|nr:hypothetical protein [Legionellaceae bacterium]
MNNTSFVIGGGSLFDRVLSLWSKNTKQPLATPHQDVSQVSQIPVGTTEMTYVGHSERNLFSSGQSIAGGSPKALAQLISKKYGNMDKNLLQDFYFVACEAGFDSPSYAEKFAAEMNLLGFWKVKVHAIVPPASNKHLVGMIVETQGKNDLISSWGYTSEQDEKSDYNFTQQKIKLMSKVRAIEGPRDRATNLNAKDKARVDLLNNDIERINKQQALIKDRGEIFCTNIDYKQEMRKPQNTFNPKSVFELYAEKNKQVEKLKSSVGVSMAKAMGFSTPNYDQALKELRLLADFKNMENEKSPLKEILADINSNKKTADELTVIKALRAFHESSYNAADGKKLIDALNENLNGITNSTSKLVYEAILNYKSILPNHTTVDTKVWPHISILTKGIGTISDTMSPKNTSMPANDSMVSRKYKETIRLLGLDGVECNHKKLITKTEKSTTAVKKRIKSTMPETYKLQIDALIKNLNNLSAIEIGSSYSEKAEALSNEIEAQEKTLMGEIAKESTSERHSNQLSCIKTDLDQIKVDIYNTRTNLLNDKEPNYQASTHKGSQI